MKMPPATGAGAATVSGTTNPPEGGIEKNINQELWQACAGPLVNLPAAGTHVVYFPQGHSEQVAASMKRDVNAQIPNYPNLPSKLLCLLQNITLHADSETDEVYAQMTLQPVTSFDKEALLRSDFSMKVNRPQTEFFCKTLTASDTSTHGGFSVPRRAAEKIFPQLDFTMQPPAQELVARDLHDNVWTFRHIYRGQPKRHLLTTGWSLFVSGKRLFAGDSVLFIRDEKQQLLLGIRRANRQPPNMSSSVLSSDSMHIGILAAAAHANANNSPFTVFYNPRASPSEFVIPLAKYYKAVCSNQLSLGMRFRMMFETEESGTRRYMGTITGISDLDPASWKNSQWRNLQVGWDESTAGEKRNRVSVWEIEPVTTPFFICPTPPFFRSKRPRIPGMPDDDTSDLDAILKRTMPWLGDDYMKDPGLSLVQWMNMQQNPQVAQPNYMNPLSGPVLQNFSGTDPARQLGVPPPQIPMIQFNSHTTKQQPQLDQFQKLPSSSFNPLVQVSDIANQSIQNSLNQNLPSSHIMQSQGLVQTQNIPQQQQRSFQNQQLHETLSQNLTQNLTPAQIQPDHVNQQLNMSENQTQLQLLHKLQHQQQAFLAQQVQGQQKPPILDASQGFSRATTPTQLVDMPQATVTSLPQSQFSQQMPKMSAQTNIHFSHHSQQQKYQPQQQLNPLAQLSAAGTGGISGITDDFPSCSTSPSTNNVPSTVQPNMNSRVQQSITIPGEEMMSSKQFENNHVKPKIDTVPKNQNQGLLVPPMYPTILGPQMDYLESTTGTSACLSQNNSMAFNQQSVMCRDTSHHRDMELHGDTRNSIVQFGTNNIGSAQLDIMPMNQDPLLTKDMVGPDKDFSNNLSSGDGMLSNVTQSFGVPDMAFGSIDSTINDNSFINQGGWAPAPQFQRMRTYTKVYKRGAVGRSIDMSRYADYEELKQDLARMFGIEGQLEDRHRVGWKLVYVDHEGDVLLVGDDPWEEFVNCVRCIKILSPQEVQAMSLDGDFGNNVIPNQACSSSGGGNL